MKTPAKKPVEDFKESRENTLALGPGDVLAFRRYTQEVWSRVAGRQITEDETDQIMEDFGRFLRALASKDGD